ncbi:MAG: glycosyltransferase [Desulfobacter sp.]
MIGLYGGTCNNMYVFAKSLSKCGLDVTFIQDRNDNFPHGQPVWDDVRHFFTSGFNQYDIDWQNFEREVQWKAPEWYFVPNNVDNPFYLLVVKSKGNLLTRLFACKYLAKFKDSYSVLCKMQECELVIACGIKAAILSMISGVPYIIWPHGSDVRTAVGAEGISYNLPTIILRKLLYKSFIEAVCIGSTMPDAGIGLPLAKYPRFNKLKVERIPIPYLPKNRLPKGERIDKLNNLLGLFNIALPESKYYAFTPSRIHFFWKGHDKLYDAIRRMDNKDIHFIFIGWGDDCQTMINRINADSANDVITVIPALLSKRLLYDFFESVDFIVDSFKAASGGYGTSLSEAMSRACPVVSWTSGLFDSPGWDAPPFIQARSEDEILAVLNKISLGEINLDFYSKRVKDWFSKVHGDEAVATIIRDKYLSQTQIDKNKDYIT